jgi:hypothetical protein
MFSAAHAITAPTSEAATGGSGLAPENIARHLATTPQVFVTLWIPPQNTIRMPAQTLNSWQCVLQPSQSLALRLS